MLRCLIAKTSGEATVNLLIMSAVLLAIDVAVFYLAKAAFQREEILTRWR